jgi:hypothetical protein
VDFTSGNFSLTVLEAVVVVVVSVVVSAYTGLAAAPTTIIVLKSTFAIF